MADPADLRRRIADGEWVVDVRPRAAEYAAAHLPGTVNIGLDGGLATHLGWLLPPGAAVTCLGATAADVAAAQREAVRIGLDRPAAMATGGPQRWSAGRPLAAYRRADFTDLAAEPAAGRAPLVLDVRRDEERAGGAVEGSRHVPLHRLLAALPGLPADRPVWVYCASGYRASIAASLLAAAGLHVVLVDDDAAAAGRRAA